MHSDNNKKRGFFEGSTSFKGKQKDVSASISTDSSAINAALAVVVLAVAFFIIKKA